jgi:hypothetical protein
MLFAGKWMELEIIMLSEVSQVQKDKVFSYMWKVDLNDKHIHKYKHYHIYNMFVIVEQFEGTKGGGRGKESE